MEASEHGALKALIGIGYRVRTALPIEEFVHVEDPEVLAVNALLVNTTNEGVVLIAWSSRKDPFCWKTLGIVLFNLIGHKIADFFHHCCAVLAHSKLALKIIAIFKLLPGDRAPLINF